MYTVSAGIPVILLLLTSFFGFFSNKLPLDPGISSWFLLLIFVKRQIWHLARIFSTGVFFFFLRLSATTEFYWLQRVGTEKGEENSEVARLMAEKRREGRGSILQGSLVHNQRIERLWRDIREMVTEYFRLLTFPRMEQLSEPDRGTGSGSSTLCIYFTD